MSAGTVLGFAHADPFDTGTWSGSSAYLFRALQAEGLSLIHI